MRLLFEVRRSKSTLGVGVAVGVYSGLGAYQLFLLSLWALFEVGRSVIE